MVLWHRQLWWGRARIGVEVHRPVHHGHGAGHKPKALYPGDRLLDTPLTTQVSEDQLLTLYRQIVLIRRSEEQLARSHQRGLIHGACHTYVRQEAIAVGVSAQLRTEDVVFSTHRGPGHPL